MSKAIRKPRRSTSQLTRDRRRIATLYLEGWLQADIAEEVSLSQSTVSNDLKALQRQWLESSLIDIDAAKAREIAKVDKLEREYYAAWRRSREDAETERIEGSSEGPSKKVLTKKNQDGDPRFLAGVQWCIDRRCKILGVDAPERREVAGSIVIELTQSNIAPDDI